MWQAVESYRRPVTRDDKRCPMVGMLPVVQAPGCRRLSLVNFSNVASWQNLLSQGCVWITSKKVTLVWVA